MTDPVLRLGTRGSRLALWQADAVRAALAAAAPVEEEEPAPNKGNRKAALSSTSVSSPSDAAESARRHDKKLNFESRV